MEAHRKQVWKWPLRLDVAGKPQLLRVPPGTEFFSAHLQGSSICAWGLVPFPSILHTREARFIEVIGTGQDLRAQWKRRFIGTIVFGPELVLHVFELLEKPDPSEVAL